MSAADIPPELYSAYLDALLAGDRRRCQTIFTGLLEGGVPVRRVYADLVKRSLYEVGVLWERNRISVAIEHVATAISEGLLNFALPYALDVDPVGKRALVAGVSPEPHQVGAKIVADVFEMNGWDSVFVGANTPEVELVRCVREVRPDVVALSLTMMFNIGALEALIIGLRRARFEPKIIVGGQGLEHQGASLAARHTEVVHIRDIEGLDEFLEQTPSARRGGE